MATGIKLQCASCEKNMGIFQCGGCNQAFCNKHSIEHRQILGMQAEEIMLECDLLQEKFNNEDEDRQRFEAERKIYIWQKEATERIVQIADQAREKFKQHFIQRKNDIKVNVKKLAESLRTARQEENFIETDLQEWIKRIDELKTKFAVPIQIVFRHNDNKLLRFVPQSDYLTDARIVNFSKLHGTLGINIQSENTYNYPIFIAKIIPDSVAEKQGGLKVGDQLLSVNDISLENEYRHTAVELIAETIGNLKLVVRYAPDDYNRLPKRND